MLSICSLDVDFPIDCDDEYWDHEDPQQNFCQPKDKPSKISFFISLLKLTEIATYVKRLIVRTLFEASARLSTYNGYSILVASP